MLNFLISKDIFKKSRNIKKNRSGKLVFKTDKEDPSSTSEKKQKKTKKIN